MKKLAISIAAIAALIGTPVLAADMAVRAPVYKAAPAAAPVWSWTGFYIGGNLGGSIGRDPTTQSVPAANATLATFTLSPAGFIGGGQIGYNYQFAPNWLIGVEGDIQGASQRDSSCVGNCSFAGGIGSLTLTDSQKVKWFATGRARLGYTDGDWLWYVTGGGAWAEVQNDFRVFVNAVDAAASANFNQSGWTIGGGVETHLGGPWTAKLEYLYLDLGSLTDVAVQSGTTFISKSDIRDHIIRVGLNYKFN